MTSKRAAQPSKEIQSLFAQGGQVAPNTCKGNGPGLTAKGTRDFLLQFDHAQIPLGQIVVERHPQIGDKAQHFMAVFEQASHQQARF